MPHARGRRRVTIGRTLFDRLAHAAQRFGDTELLVVGRRAETLTFRQLAEQADRFGRVLHGLGVRPGDRVAVWMTNQAAWAVAAYGIARCGGVLVAVNTRLAPREVAHMLELTRPRVWLLEDNFLGKVQATDHVAPVLDALRAADVPPPTIVVRSRSGRRYDGMPDWDETVATWGDAPPLPPATEMVARTAAAEYPELRGAAAILSTSGTTGKPKGVVLGHEQLIHLAEAVAERQLLRPGERLYSVGPMFHCSGYMHGLLCNLISGSTYFTTPAYNAEETWDVFSSEGITLYHGFAIPLQEMARLPQFDRTKLRFDRAWFGAVANEMARLEAVYGARMCEIYGLTETGGNTSICWPHDPVDMRHDSDGRPNDGVEVKMIDPVTGATQPDGTPGELCVRGWNVMLGYFRDPEATARTIDADGWLHTGDMGVQLKDGFIQWLSRLKDMIRVGGENLSPLEVEEVLIGHPAVAQAAVVAVPHPRLQEVPVAFLILKRGAQADPADLEQHCRGLLANFKVPRRFVIVDDFPRTDATMRVQKAKLRVMAEAL
jgi:acyl-CoA synthetase (AMP-forming)/AMP-acid ligase II